MSELLDSVTTPLDRRQLLRIGGLAGLGALGAGVLAGCGGDSSITPGGSGGLGGSAALDRDVLNFALNLEYLEAEYYLRGTRGTGLSGGEAGSGAGSVTGGRQVSFSSSLMQQMMEEIAQDELDHVLFLRSALGGSAVARPAINFTDAFNAAAQAAGLGATFDPFANETNFLIGAFVFEDVGVTAYHGGARLISNRDTLVAAAGILGTEAYHAGSIRTQILQVGGEAVTAANAISNLRASVGGGKDQGVTLSGEANVVPTDNNGITFERTTREVLNIVYLSSGQNHGGFFPNGLNGNVR